MPSEYATIPNISHSFSEKFEETERTNVPSLRDEYSQEENHEQPNGSHPSVRHVRRRFVQPCLVLLFHPLSVKPFSNSDTKSRVPGRVQQDLLVEALRYARSQPQKGFAQAPLNPSLRTLLIFFS